MSCECRCVIGRSNDGQGDVTVLAPCCMHADWKRDGKPVEAGIPMRLNCPGCGTLHVDEGEYATKPHATHACQTCGMVWKPAKVNTVGVKFLPGYGPA